MEKYDRQGPRYTSYPPVPFWKDAPGENEWITHLSANYNSNEGVDLYVHVPFCEKLCYYCGCNKVITRSHDGEDSFVELLLHEWKIYCERMGFEPAINSLHFGGGTPTFLSAPNLEKIIVGLVKNKTAHFTGSIEVDPRNVSLEQLDCFKKNGISRVSLGIQDFDTDVQTAINRYQSFEMVETLMLELRKRKFDSINFDIIYGLPKQTLKTIRETFKLVTMLKPDLIAYYSYAHLPDRISSQKLIKTQDLPQGNDKQLLYEEGKVLLAGNGYLDIGMDHFALPDNFLSKAKMNHSLDRNFMGYVEKKSNILIGLGPSAISNSSVSFIQNSKKLSDYEVKIKGDQLAISSGHTHVEDDLVAQRIILELMCNEEVSFNPESFPYEDEIKRELSEMEADGLIARAGNKISILPLGKKFLRNVAMVFDYHYREKVAVTKFSRTI